MQENYLKGLKKLSLSHGAHQSFENNLYFKLL